MLTIEKFHLTLESVNAFIKERYWKVNEFAFLNKLFSCF
jgi:hypothetical protein